MIYFSHTFAPLDNNAPLRSLQGTFSALQKICEDSPKDLESSLLNGVPVLNLMIPRIVSFFNHASTKVRASAITCINQFILSRSQALMLNIDVFVQALYERANDTAPPVRKQVCQALVMLLEVRPDKLVPSLPAVVEFMLYCTQDEDESVALEACEFWLAFAEQDELRDHLEPFLPKFVQRSVSVRWFLFLRIFDLRVSSSFLASQFFRFLCFGLGSASLRIIPVLLKGMVYTDDDVAALVGSEEDFSVPDSAQDLKPRFHKAKTHAFEHVDGQSAPKQQSQPTDNDDDDIADSEEDDEEDEDDEAYQEWNLRKCSAAALDVLATVFGDDLLDVLLPLLQEKLGSGDWKEREAAVLALGAVAEGV